METDHDRPDRRTYVESSGAEPAVAGSAGVAPASCRRPPTDGGDPEAVYRARHRRLGAAGRFERLIREGGMGAVLEVRGTVLDLGLGGGRFAVKLIKERLLGEPEVAARFRRELASHRRLSASFQVPRLVPCLAFAEDDDPGKVFGVFPFYPDGTLEEALGQDLTVSEALWLLADAVEGLQSLHGLRYVHRDFHPSNVLIDREGGRRRGVLGDLGVGTFLQSNTIFTDTQLGVDRRRQVGHRGYIDPFYRASPQADLYAVGATLYRILTGRVPAAGRSSRAGAPEARVLTLPDGMAAIDRPEIHRAATGLLAGLTAQEGGDRYSSVREARVDLVALAELMQEREPRSVSAPAVRVRPKRRRPAASRLGWTAAVTALVVSSAALTLGLSSEIAPAGQIPQQGALHPVAGAPLPQRGREPEPPPSESLTPDPSPRPTLRTRPGRGVPPPLLGQEDTRVSTNPPLSRLAPATEVSRIDPLLRGRRHRKAEALSRQLWERYPADPEVAGRLALLLQVNRGEAGVREARTVLAAALDRHPGRGDLRLALARVLLELEPPAAAGRLLAAAPAAGTHGGEIEALRVTIARRGDQSK